MIKTNNTYFKCININWIYTSHYNKQNKMYTLITRSLIWGNVCSRTSGRMYFYYAKLYMTRRCVLTIDFICLHDCINIGLGLWCLTPLSTIFQLYRSVLLVEETAAPRENHQPVSSHWQTLSHNAVFSMPCDEWDSNSQL